MQSRGWGMYDAVSDKDVEAAIARIGRKKRRVRVDTGQNALLLAAQRVQQFYMPRLQEPVLQA